MQSPEDDLYLCHSLWVKAIQADHLAAVVALETMRDKILDSINAQRRGKRRT